MLAVAIETTGERLRKLREAQSPRWSQRKAAEFLEIKEETYRSYEYDRSTLPEPLARRLAEAWGIPSKTFYGDSKLVIADGTAALISEIPFYGPAPAGPWERDESDPSTIEVAGDLDPKEHFAIRVIGVSMWPDLFPGDLAICKVGKHPPIGAIVFAVNESQERTVKRLSFDESTHAYLLRANKPEDHPMPVEEWSVRGYVVRTIRDFI